MFKKFVASILILPFLIVPLFCVCKTAQAAPLGVEHCQDGDDDSADHHEHSKADHAHASCDCHSLSTVAENTPTAHISFLSFPNLFPAVDVTALKSAIHFKGPVHIAYLGPLGVSSAVPLYTLYHSLRI